MKKFLTIVFMGLSVYSFICLFHAVAYAQQHTGITVHPSSIQLDLATDKPQAVLTYINNTTEPVTLLFSTADVTDSGDSYSVSYLPQKDARNFTYGLSSWVSFSNDTLLLEPGEKGTETVFIDARQLTPGGHYGSILAQVQSTNSSAQVAIKSTLATLIFVRAHTGKEYEKGSISTFVPEQDFFDFPKNFLLRFTNSGDTYVTPYGSVIISDMWGNFVGKGVLNTGSLFVLPESLRRMEIPTQTFGGILWPGMYHATLSMHFGQTNQKLTSTTTFFSFGSLPILQILVVLLMLINAYLFLRKKHKSTQ